MIERNDEANTLGMSEYISTMKEPTASHNVPEGKALKKVPSTRNHGWMRLITKGNSIK
jgi:hypothetical protein